MKNLVKINGNDLTIEDVVAVARFGVKVELDENQKEAILTSRKYVAAALVSENKVLAHPSSVDSIPTSANQEDHVSMGTIGARKARTIVNHAQHVISIELLCAAQAADFGEVSKLGKGTKVAYDTLRSKVDFMENDVIFYPDMDKSFELVQSAELLDNVEKVIGQLK